LPTDDKQRANSKKPTASSSDDTQDTLLSGDSVLAQINSSQVIDVSVKKHGSSDNDFSDLSAKKSDKSVTFLASQLGETGEADAITTKADDTLLAALVSSSAFVNALFLPLLLSSAKRVSSALVVMASASPVSPNCEAKKVTLLSLFFALKSLKSLSLLPCFFTLHQVTCEEFICAKTLSPDNNVSCVSSLDEV
jgi:hypothetical protein